MNIKVNFLKYNPSGNTTVLVCDQIEDSLKPTVAKELLAYTGADQLGFIVKPKDSRAIARVDMMAGEFCGNASRCLACAVYDGSSDVLIESSGYDGLLKAEVIKNDDYFVSIDMPLPVKILHSHDISLGDFSIASFEGIVHIILSDKEPEDSIVDEAEELINKLGFSTECFGVIFFNENGKKAVPIVRVKALDMTTREGSCGSGTTAVLAILASKYKRSFVDYELKQPGGTLVGTAIYEDGIKKLKLAGIIELVEDFRV